jgi:hypothetical protein
LRFEEPSGILIAKPYQDLAAIEGVAAGSLFTPPGSWPAGMQSIINGVTGLMQQVGDFLSGQGSGGGSGGGSPGAGKKFDGGNNTNTPKEDGVIRSEAWKSGLGYNCKKRTSWPTQIVLHCTATSRNFLQTLKSQNQDKDVRLNYNFIINRDGSFTQAVHPDLRCAHAGGKKNVSQDRYGFKIGLSPKAVGVSWCNMAGDAYKANGVLRYETVNGKRKAIFNKKPDSIKALSNPGFAGYARGDTFKWKDKATGMSIQKGRNKWHEKYSQASIDAGINICAVLCLKYEMDPMNQIWSHQMLTNKGDPGGSFYPVESEQMIKYDPNLVLFKTKVKERMAYYKDKQLLDWKDRIVAGWNAPEEAPPPDPNAPPPDPNAPPPDPNAPVDNDGKKIPEGKEKKEEGGGGFFGGLFD